MNHRVNKPSNVGGVGAAAARPPVEDFEITRINRASGAAIGFIAACLIFIGLAVMVKFYVSVPAMDADAASVRTRDLAEIRATEDKTLATAGWIDQSRGIVRLPIETAMQESLQAWQNPAQARAGLITRQENASKPAPVAPEKPSAFE